MKPILLTLTIAILAIGSPGCALLPPKAGVAPTATQAKLSADLQTVASAIRHIEGADMTAQQAVAFLDTYTAGVEDIAPYVSDAKLALKIVYAAGAPTESALEALATRYDE